MRSLAMLLCFCLPLLPAIAPAQDHAPSPEVDKLVNRAVVRVIREGVALYNQNGDALGCYRVYQGGLTALTPLLTQWPDLLKKVEDALALAPSKPDYSSAAFTLRDALNQVYDATRPAKPVTSAEKPLWDRLGGQPAVEAVVKDFVALAAADKDVDFLRDGKYNLDADGVTRLEKLLVELISSVTGGPLEYSGRGMKESHAGMKITEAEFGALAADLVAVLRKYEVDQKEIDELIGIVASTKADIVEPADEPAAPAPEANPSNPSN